MSSIISINLLAVLFLEVPFENSKQLELVDFAPHSYTVRIAFLYTSLVSRF